jgi:hypothetical protein
VYVPCRWHRCARVPLIIGAAVFLSGCWTPPSASVRPTGEPRVIERGIEVERVLDSATVESVDRVARTLGLSGPGIPVTVCRIGRGVRDWGDIRIGDRVRARIEEVLTVYLPPVNEAGGPGVSVGSRSPDARVLVVDPSYRVLKVQYPNGGTEAFKVGLHMPMSDLEAGDFVAIRRAEVVELHVRRQW